MLVVDEAGMVGTRQLARVATKIEAIGAKLVLIGDPDQLQPIEAGTPFRDLVDRQGAATLSDIHRQREDWQKQASRDLASGDVAKAMTTYENKGAVRRGGDAFDALVESYAMDVAANGDAVSRLAFAHRRKDVGNSRESHHIRTCDQNGRRPTANDPARPTFFPELRSWLRGHDP